MPKVEYTRRNKQQRQRLQDYECAGNKRGTGDNFNKAKIVIDKYKKVQDMVRQHIVQNKRIITFKNMF